MDRLHRTKEGLILFKEKAKVALEKAEEVSNGNLRQKNKEEMWEVLGEVEKAALKKNHRRIYKNP